MSNISIIVNNNVYDCFNLNNNKIKHSALTEQSYMTVFKYCQLDCVFVHYLIKELNISNNYRKNFLNFHGSCTLVIILQPTKCDLIDYNWNIMCCQIAWERLELDHALSWLSTLGGAFSALGDYYDDYAKVAGQISINQLRLAIKLNDPLIILRCKLFFSLSLIQRKQFKWAKKLIISVYNETKNSFISDTRLIRMCKGIWSKLQYENNKRLKLK